MSQLYVYFSLLNVTDPMYIQQPREVILPHIQNVVGICKQITMISRGKQRNMEMNLLWRHCVHHNNHLNLPVIKPEFPRWEARVKAWLE
jgi:hypothetical protein